MPHAYCDFLPSKVKLQLQVSREARSVDRVRLTRTATDSTQSKASS
jgi:hypothetical protein